MKRIALPFCILALTVGPAIGKPVPPLVPIPLLADGSYGYEQVIEAPGLSQAELFTRAQTWITSTYLSGGALVPHVEKRLFTVKTSLEVKHPYYAPERDPNDKCTLTIGTQSADRESGTLAVGGVFSIEHPTCGPNGVVNVTSTLTINVKDGKWRYRFTDFSTDYPDGHPFMCNDVPTSPLKIDVAKRWGREVVNHTSEASTAILDSLKAAMAKPVEAW